MLRVLHLCPTWSDLQTRHALQLLLSSNPPGIQPHVVRIGPGGDCPNLAAATLYLRSSRAPEADILHAWGPTELCAGVLAGFPRIIFSPPSSIPMRWNKWL